MDNALSPPATRPDLTPGSRPDLVSTAGAAAAAPPHFPAGKCRNHRTLIPLRLVAVTPRPHLKPHVRVVTWSASRFDLRIAIDDARTDRRTATSGFPYRFYHLERRRYSERCRRQEAREGGSRSRCVCRSWDLLARRTCRRSGSPTCAPILRSWKQLLAVARGWVRGCGVKAYEWAGGWLCRRRRLAGPARRCPPAHLDRRSA